MKAAAVVLAVLLALPGLAGEKQKAKHPSGEWLLGFGTNYVDKLGAGGMAGYHFKDHGITILGSVNAIQLKGENGTTEFRRFCTTYHVPFSTGDRTEAQYSVNVLFTLKKYK